MDKIKFKTLSIRNFRSFGNNTTTIDLSEEKLRLIVGENKDVGADGESKNGAGKSSIAEALLFALFGDGFSDVKLDEFINVFNKKGLYVSLDFSIGEDEYTVTRTRKPNNLEFTVNGEPQTEGSAKNTDQYIINTLGYDSEIFMNAFMLTNSGPNFINLKTAGHRAIMEKLFETTKLNERAAQLKAEEKNIKVDLAVEEESVKIKEEQAKKAKEMKTVLKEKEEFFQEERRTAIDQLKARLDVLTKVDTDKEKRLNEQIASINNELTTVSNAVATISNEIRTLLAKATKKKEELEELRNDKCPRCKQAWVSETEILSVESDISETERTIDTLAEALREKAEAEKVLKKMFNDILPDGNMPLSINEINRIEQEMNTVIAQIKQLEENDLNPYTEQLEQLEEMGEDVDKSKLYELHSLATHYKFLIKMLTDSKSFIRKNLIDQYAPIFNQSVNKYLDMLDSPHIFELNSDLSISIDYMGRKMSIGSVSTGERIRLSFAISLAFRDFLEMTGRDSNILFIDEIMDSGGDVNVYKNIMRIVKEKSYSTFIISHQEWVKSVVDETITVVKEHGFSEIVYG